MFVYEEFPPRVPCNIPKRDDVIGKPMKYLKKPFQKAVINYHPDKQDEFETEWKVLCEVIVEYLSEFYEITKKAS